jgi:hypothetical protein
MVSQPLEVREQIRIAQGQPFLIFLTELEGAALHEFLLQEDVLADLEPLQYGLAVALMHFTDAQADAIRLLNAHNIYTVAWLLLPMSEGCWFNLQNYPQAVEHYRDFRAWASEHDLHFDAVGIDIEPPPDDMPITRPWSLRGLARRLWLARENVLYQPARAAYRELVTDIRRDGYEVHVYQLPLIADDRRAGTTLLQRAFDVVDLPADLEVLMCYSSLPIALLDNDLGGALITSYGPAADSIGVGYTRPHTLLEAPAGRATGDETTALSWATLERDLLLAARYTDTIYILSLEGCVKRDLLRHVARLDWSSEPHWSSERRLIVGSVRIALWLVLLWGRYYQLLFAWLGWGIALLLLVQRWRQRSRDRLR